MDPSRLGPKAEGAAYEQFRDALAMVESSNKPGNVQRSTKGMGLYQFLPKYFEGFTQQEFGRSLESFLPKDDSQAEADRAGTEQRDVLFARYYEKQVAPFVADTRKRGLAKDKSDIEIASTFHFVGGGGARKYFKSGFDSAVGTKDNVSIDTYNRRMAGYVGRPTGPFRTMDGETMLASKDTGKAPVAVKPTEVATNYSKAPTSGVSLTMTEAQALASDKDVMDRLARLAMELRDKYS